MVVWVSRSLDTSRNAHTSPMAAPPDFDTMVLGVRSVMEREMRGDFEAEVDPALLRAGYDFALVAGRVAHKLTCDVEALQARIRVMAGDHMALMAIDKGLAATNATLVAELERARSGTAERAAEAKQYRLQLDNDVIRATLEEEQKEVQRLQKEVLHLQDELAAVDHTKHTSRDLERLRAEYTMELDDLSSALRGARAEVVSAHAEAAAARAEAERAQAEMTKLRATYKDADRIATSLRVKLDAAMRARVVAVAEADSARVEAAAAQADTEALAAKVQAQMDEIAKTKALCTEALRSSQAIRAQSRADVESVTTRMGAERETMLSLMNAASVENVKNTWYHATLMGDDPAHHTLARVETMVNDVLDSDVDPVDIRYTLVFVRDMITHMRRECTRFEKASITGGVTMAGVAALMRVLSTSMLDDNAAVLSRVEDAYAVVAAHGSHAEVLAAVDGVRCVVQELAAYVRATKRDGKAQP